MRQRGGKAQNGRRQMGEQKAAHIEKGLKGHTPKSFLLPFLLTPLPSSGYCMGSPARPIIHASSS